MLFIGFFSSFIPYLIIAVVYLAGIVMYTLENKQPKTGFPDNKTNIIVETAKNSSESNSIHYYSSDSSNDSESFYSLTPEHKSFAESGKTLLCFHKPPAKSLESNPSHFSRPPPFFFIS